MIKVTAGIIEKYGQILIAKRRKGDHLEGKWEFPGGKIEHGETPEECLKRELREEFGIETVINEFICSNKHNYGHIEIELLAYSVSHISGDFTINNHEEIKWVTTHELLNCDLADADVPIAEVLGKRDRGSLR